MEGDTSGPYSWTDPIINEQQVILVHKHDSCPWNLPFVPDYNSHDSLAASLWAFHVLDVTRGELWIEFDCHKKGPNNRKNKYSIYFLEAEDDK